MTHRPFAAMAAAALLAASSAIGQATVAAPPRPVSTAAANQTVANARAMAVKPMPANIAAIHAKISPRLSPAARTWVQSEARVIAGRHLTASQMIATTRGDAGKRFAGQGLAGMDVEALVMCVMMQASEDAQNDLKDQLAAMQKATAQKRALRADEEAMAKAQQAMKDSLKHESDQLGDITQEQQLQLQRQMDQMTQFEEAMSNIMRSLSGTESQVLTNLK